MLLMVTMCQYTTIFSSSNCIRGIFVSSRRFTCSLVMNLIDTVLYPSYSALEMNDVKSIIHLIGFPLGATMTLFRRVEFNRGIRYTGMIKVHYVRINRFVSVSNFMPRSRVGWFPLTLTLIAVEGSNGLEMSLKLESFLDVLLRTTGRSLAILLSFGMMFGGRSRVDGVVFLMEGCKYPRNLRQG